MDYKRWTPVGSKTKRKVEKQAVAKPGNDTLVSESLVAYIPRYNLLTKAISDMYQCLEPKVSNTSKSAAPLRLRGRLFISIEPECKEIP